MTVRITCINKSGGYHDNPHAAISHYGWLYSSEKRGKMTRIQAVEWIGKGNDAYVENAYGNKAYCYVRTSTNGVKFLQTQSDGRDTNNLLELPEC
jgi:hypothetical protein